MKKFIKNYIELMNKYILVKVVTVLLIVMLLSQIMTVINNKLNEKNNNENPISTYNTYDTRSRTVNDVATRYFNEYISLMQYDIELAYSLLDEFCRKNYTDVEEFKRDIDNIDFENIHINHCELIQDEESKKYIVTDNYNNTYSFILSEINKYNVVFNTSK